MSTWQEEHAQQWAETVLEALATVYPSMAHHTATDAEGCDVAPQALHPAFWGCLDWHSSVHMQWSALTLLGLAPAHLDAATYEALVATLDARLSPGALAIEAAYLREHPLYERPYGWAWALTLAAAVSTSRVPQAQRWSTALAPLADQLFDAVVAWLPHLQHAVRYGVHDNTAFALGLIWDAAATLQRPDVIDAIAARAKAWFGADKDYPVAWEPSGNDFLSAALCEADLMRRVLSASAFERWLLAFLPRLGHEGDPLLVAPQVTDPTDGKLVHLYGLALSRAWMLRSLLPFLDGDAASRVARATPALVDAAREAVNDGDFMSTHWLVTFALMAAVRA